MIARAIFHFLSEFAKIIRDQKGQVVIIFTIMVPVIIGLIGLSLEGGRLLLLNSQLQDLADAAALAGAKELDGAGDAIDRARIAAKTLSNDTWWSNIVVSGVQIVDPPIFYSAIKCIPNCKLTPSDVVILAITDPIQEAQAAYIKVTTVTRQLAPAFLVTVGATSIAQTNATATAGSTYIACNVQPLMLCNPYEDPVNGGGTPFHATPGQLFWFTPAGGGKSQFSPGDFSLLDPSGSTNSGATAIRNLLSQTSPNFCYVDNVSLRPGQSATDVADGINVRFDMQPNGQNQLAGLDQTPAPNVIKGMILNDYINCNWNNPPMVPYAALPGDTDMAYQGNALIGNTMDMHDANAYWNYHHGGTWPANTTRYAAYQLEMQMSPSQWVNVPPNENPAPQCAPAVVRNAGNDTRRIISVAVVNCVKNQIKGNSVTSVRSNTYADFFLTQPVSKSGPQNGIIYAEFVRMMTPQSDGTKLHHVVQLYRDY